MSILAAPEPAHRTDTDTIVDTLWIWFYRSLPVLVLALIMLGVIK